MPTILDAIKAKNPELLKKLVTERIHQNIREGLDAEKKAAASSLLTPRLAEVYINVGDRIRTKRMGQTAGTVVKVENGNVYFELDEPEGKFGKRIWAAPLSNVVKEAMGHVGSTPGDKGRMAAADDDYNKKYDVPFKKKDGTTVNRKVTVPPSNNESISEDSVSQHEVQRIYDEIGDIGETELLCGISSLRVNPQGQVISYICEATGTGFPNGWERGWTYPYKIGGGGTERPFVKDGRWYLLVYNQETSKREIYSFYDDVFLPEKEFYKEDVGPADIGLEASSLGWKPGTWPGLMTYKGTTYRRGAPERRDGELVAVEYVRDDSKGPYFSSVPRKITVFND